MVCPNLRREKGDVEEKAPPDHLSQYKSSTPINLTQIEPMNIILHQPDY